MSRSLLTPCARGIWRSRSAFYRLDGTPQENNGEKPDFQVSMSPQDWLKERDPQLDKAIDLLRNASKSQPPVPELSKSAPPCLPPANSVP